MEDFMTLSEVLAAVDRREITLDILEPPTWCGYPKYRAAGWEFVVFDDCGYWDYLEQVTSPEGRMRGACGSTYVTAGLVRP